MSHPYWQQELRKHLGKTSSVHPLYHHVFLVFANRAGGTVCHHVILEGMLLKHYSAHQLGRHDQGPVHQSSSLTVKLSESIESQDVLGWKEPSSPTPML